MAERATEPIEATASPSKGADQVVPLLVVLNRPPVPAAAKMVEDPGRAAKADIRPPMTAGPIARNLSER